MLLFECVIPRFFTPSLCNPPSLKAKVLHIIRFSKHSFENFPYFSFVLACFSGSSGVFLRQLRLGDNRLQKVVVYLPCQSGKTVQGLTLTGEVSLPRPSPP